MTIQDSLDYANVTLRFDINILPDGIIVDTLQVYHYSEEDGWEASKTGGVDLETGTVWGHFSNFSVPEQEEDGLQPEKPHGTRVEFYLRGSRRPACSWRKRPGSAVTAAGRRKSHAM